MVRYIKRWFQFIALCAVIPSCADRVESPCELVVFFGKHACIPCNVALMQLLENECFRKQAVSVTFVLYSRGSDSHAVFSELEIEYSQTSYQEFDFEAIPVDRIHRSTVRKPHLYFISNDSLRFSFTDYSQPINFVGVLEICEECSIRGVESAD